MPITAVAAGAWAFLTANGAVTIPGGGAAGDRMYLFSTWKAFGTTADVSGWTEVTEFAGGSVAPAANVGSTKVGCWYKDHSGSESNPTITFSVAPVPAATVIVIFRKDAGESWDAPRLRDRGDRLGIRLHGHRLLEPRHHRR